MSSSYHPSSPARQAPPTSWRRPVAALLAVASVTLAGTSPALAGDNLIPNGGFEHAKGELHGWITDYAWTGNSH